MRVLVIGAGLVGTAAAQALTERGHEVTVTATSPEKVETLARTHAHALLVRGSEAETVAAAVAGQDAVVVTAGPSAQGSMTPEGRERTYHDVLVGTARNVVAGTGEGVRLVALSSLSVYGDAADHLDEIDESAPVTSSTDPSPRNFLAMERVYADAGDRAVVFRCGDIFGAGDPPITEKVKMAHTYLGGSVPFSAAALLYRLDVQDAAEAIVFAVEGTASGIFNLTHAERPPRNAALFDSLSAEQGLPPLEYRGEIASPSSPVSVRRLAEAGFRATRSFDPALAEFGD